LISHARIIFFNTFLSKAAFEGTEPGAGGGGKIGEDEDGNDSDEDCHRAFDEK